MSQSTSSQNSKKKERHKSEFNKVIFGHLKDYIKDDPELTELREFLEARATEPDFNLSNFYELRSIVEEAAEDSLKTERVITELRTDLDIANKEIKTLKDQLARSKTKKPIAESTPKVPHYTSNNRLTLIRLNSPSPPSTANCNLTTVAQINHNPSPTASQLSSCSSRKRSLQTTVTKNKKKSRLVLHTPPTSPSASPIPHIPQSQFRSSSTSAFQPIQSSTPNSINCIYPATQSPQPHSTQSQTISTSQVQQNNNNIDINNETIKSIKNNFYLGDSELESLNKYVQKYSQLNSNSNNSFRETATDRSHKARCHLTVTAKKLADPTATNNPHPTHLALYHIFQKNIFAPLEKFKHIQDITIEKSERIVAGLSDLQTRCIGKNIRTFKQAYFDANGVQPRLYNISRAIDNKLTNLHKSKYITTKNKNKIDKSTFIIEKPFSIPKTAGTDRDQQSSESD